MHLTYKLDIFEFYGVPVVLYQSQDAQKVSHNIIYDMTNDYGIIHDYP